MRLDALIFYPFDPKFENVITNCLEAFSEFVNIKKCIFK